MIKTRILIVGGGISGLSIAYSLVKRGVNDIVIVEKSYLGSGSTGRCASGIRASFTSREHVVLMKHSIELWKKYAEGELGKHGLYYNQGGYIWLASREETAKIMERLVKLHNSLGVPTRIIGLDELKKLVPPIETKGVVSVLFDPTGGKSSPFSTIFAFYNLLRKKGIRIYLHTSVEEILHDDKRVYGAITSKGEIRAETIVVAAGASTRKLLEPLGVKVPLKNLPRHAMLTEAYREAFKPLVIDWDTPGVPYIVQMKSGSFLIARNIDEGPELSLYSQRIDFMPKAVKPLVRFFPWLRNTRIMRYWMGYYITTPDHHPIYGSVKGYENLYIATGFSGHGYMMAPVTGEVIAEWILNGRPSIDAAKRLVLERFEKGALIKELAVVG